MREERESEEENVEKKKLFFTVDSFISAAVRSTKGIAQDCTVMTLLVLKILIFRSFDSFICWYANGYLATSSTTQKHNGACLTLSISAYQLLLQSGRSLFYNITSELFLFKWHCCQVFITNWRFHYLPSILLSYSVNAKSSQGWAVVRSYQ